MFNFTPVDRFRVAADLTWEHGPATEEFRGNVAVEYAFAEYSVRDWLRLRAGKMFTPFSIYNEIHTAKPLFLSVKEPVSTNKIEKMGSTIRFYPRWGAGLTVLGNGQLAGKDWDYVVQVSNGEQRSAAAMDEEYPNPFDDGQRPPQGLGGSRPLPPGARAGGGRLRVRRPPPRVRRHRTLSPAARRSC